MLKARKKILSNRDTDSGNSVGGQVGHKGSTLSFADTADVEVDHKPSICSNCGLKLSGVVLKIFT